MDAPHGDDDKREKSDRRDEAEDRRKLGPEEAKQRLKELGLEVDRRRGDRRSGVDRRD